MIIDKKTEDHMYLTLKALVEELGPESITVSLPKSWQNPKYSLGSVKLEFTTENIIKINAKYNKDFINYEVKVL